MSFGLIASRLVIDFARQPVITVWTKAGNDAHPKTRLGRWTLAVGTVAKWEEKSDAEMYVYAGSDATQDPVINMRGNTR